MKNEVITLVFVLLCSILKAQDSTIMLSKFEQLTTTRGKFYSIEEKIVGNVRNRNVTVIRVKDMNANETLSAVRITGRVWNDEPVPIVNYSNLYFDKVDLIEVIKNLEFYLLQINKNNGIFPGIYFTYVTSADVEVVCQYYQGFSSEIFLTISKLYQYKRTPVPYTTITFRKKDMESLIDLLKIATNQL